MAMVCFAAWNMYGGVEFVFGNVEHAHAHMEASLLTQLILYPSFPVAWLLSAQSASQVNPRKACIWRYLGDVDFFTAILP